MLRFEGDRDFPQAQAEVCARLTDPSFLVQCIPDVESVTRLEADRASLVLRPGFAFVRGTLDVTLQVVDAVPPTSARLLLHSKGIGSSANVEAALDLAPEGNGTRVHWVAEVKELGGLLKMVPGGLIRGAAQKVIGDAWTAVAAKLAAPPGR
jgi:carbon monoxide dehydrogenase subunit G